MIASTAHFKHTRMGDNILATNCFLQIHMVTVVSPGASKTFED